jgi:multidrug efflux pump subunit AcrA (membrane-fusion protein)
MLLGRVTVHAFRAHGPLPLRIAVALAVVAGVAAVAAVGPAGTILSWPGLSRAEPARLAASGTIEAEEVTLSAELPARVVLLAEEGQRLAAGAVAARLDDTLVAAQLS